MTVPYSAPDLLSLFNRLAARPAADAVLDTDKYDRLSKAQQRVVMEASAIYPAAFYQKVAYGSIPTLSTVDNQVWTFGLDGDDNPIVPFGKTNIYTSLAAIPDDPWLECIDYLNEQTQIRIPNNRSYSGTLYWRGVQIPGVVNATTDPVLFPTPARELIVIDAVRQFAKEGSRNPDLAADMQAEWDRQFPLHCYTWKTQFQKGGALVYGTYTGKQLATLQQIS